MEPTGKQFYSMQKDINFLKEKSYSQTRDLGEIKKALLGDEFNPGFKQRIETVEVQSREFEKFQQKVKLTAGLIASGLGLIGLIVTILKNWSDLI